MSDVESNLLVYTNVTRIDGIKTIFIATTIYLIISVRKEAGLCFICCFCYKYSLNDVKVKIIINQCACCLNHIVWLLIIFKIFKNENEKRQGGIQ